MKLLNSILLFLISISFLSLPVNAFTDSFQNHPGNSITDVWNIFNLVSIVNFPVSNPQSLVAQLTPNSSFPAYIEMKPSFGSLSNYWSFVRRTSAPSNSNNIQFQFFNKTGASLFFGTLPSVTIPTTTLIEFVITGGTLNLYMNGTSYGSLGAISQTPYYMQIRAVTLLGLQNFDDVSNQPGIISPDNNYNELSLFINSSWTKYAAWAFPASIYQIHLRSFSSGVIINTTNITNSGYAGWINWSIPTIIGASNYGYYQMYLTKDGTLESSGTFLYSPSIALGTINLTQDSYSVGDPMIASYTLASPDFGTYTYKAYVVRLSDLNTVATQSIIASSGTVTFDTTTFLPDTYYVILARTTGGVQQDIAYDFALVGNTFNVNGVTYNAENGSAISGVNINDSQGSNFFNATSNTSGIYNLTNLDITQTTIAASKTNFTHTNWTYTPLSAQTTTINLYLIPTNPNIRNTTILGLVGSFPWHQAISGATVNIWNSTWNSTNTTPTDGYYTFTELLNGSSYNMNASATNYATSSNVIVSVVNGSFVIQNFVLVPSFQLTITAQDSVTGALLDSFTACISNSCLSTVLGNVTFTLPYGLYNVQVSATSHYSNQVQTLLSNTKTVNIQLTPTSSQSSTLFQTVPHDVSFVVQDLAFNKKLGLYVTAQGFNTTVGNFTTLSNLIGVNFNLTPINNVAMNGTTGTDGSIDFKMDGSIYYILNFSGVGISSFTWSGYPTQYQYIIITPTTYSGTFTNNTSLLSTITINISTQTINATAANISANYTDILNQTTTLIFYLNQSVPGDPNNQTNIQTINGGTNATFNATFTITPYSSNNYIINIHIVHTSLGIIDNSYGVVFPQISPLINFSPVSVLMLLVGFIFFIAGFFGQTSTEQGAGIIVGFVWLLSGMSLLANLGLGTNFYLGLTLATVIVIIMNINARSRREGIQ